MRDTQSMILGNGDGKVKMAPAPAPKEETSVQADVTKPVDQLPASGNGYAQAAARVNVVNDAIQGKTRVNNEEVQPVADLTHPTTTTSEVKQPKFEKLEDVTNALYRKRMPSEEELAKEKKRERSRAVISAIADGVSAFSNLYFTGKGANNVKQTSMSAANAKRYQDILDKRMKMQGEWDNARLAAYDKDRGFEYQLNKDKKADERYDSEWNRSGEWHEDAVHREDAVRRENKDARDRGIALQEIAQKDASDRWRATLSAQKKAQEDSVRIQEERIKATGEKVAKGKRIGFSDGSGNDVGIYENVWKGSMQQVFDTLSKDFRPDKISESMWSRKVAKMTSREKEDFVKQNWTKSPRASAIMKALSQIDPVGANGSLRQSESDDLGFAPLSSGSGMDVDALFD